MNTFITRFAPTPSGFLHIGNMCNFALTYALSRTLNASLELRIDDIDTPRVKKIYIDDIFETLRFLGLEYDYGAKDSDDFLKNYSFSQKKLFEKTQNLREKYPNFFYACKCSRKSIDGIYHGKCRNLGLELKSGESALRVCAQKDDFVKLGEEFSVYENFGDGVVWSKDGFCSYQLASLLDDEERNINLLVRGEDLLMSSVFQLFLAKKFGFKSFINAVFIHHPLILDDKNKKLSKSTNADNTALLKRDDRVRAMVFKSVAKMIGVKEFDEINTKEELLMCKNELRQFFEQKGEKVG